MVVLQHDCSLSMVATGPLSGTDVQAAFPGVNKTHHHGWCHCAHPPEICRCLCQTAGDHTCPARSSSPAAVSGLPDQFTLQPCLCQIVAGGAPSGQALSACLCPDTYIQLDDAQSCLRQIAAGGASAQAAVAAQRQRTKARKRALAEQRRAAVMTSMAAAQARPCILHALCADMHCSA